MKLPDIGATPLIRTDFSDDEAWTRLIAATGQPSADGFLANLIVIDDRDFENADQNELARIAEEETEKVNLIVIADAETLADPEQPLLCVDPIPPGGSFRVIPSELWSVENNVATANLDFSEFAAAVDPDGVFRGFPEE